LFVEDAVRFVFETNAAEAERTRFKIITIKTVVRIYCSLYAAVNMSCIITNSHNSIIIMTLQTARRKRVYDIFHKCSVSTEANIFSIFNGIIHKSMINIFAHQV
jgi:hypothetical protein